MIGIVDYVPFPDMPEFPVSVDPRAEYGDRARALHAHENQREASIKSREIYDINSYPCFVPWWALPSMGDDPKTARAKAERINSLNNKD